jgi:predicted transcriptional regulator
MTTLTFRVPDELNQILEDLCREEDRSKSWFMKRVLQEKLEEWQDLKIAKKGRAEYEKNPHLTLSHDELMKELGLKKKARK